jgi:hypothetical protein
MRTYNCETHDEQENVESDNCLRIRLKLFLHYRFDEKQRFANTCNC